MKRTVRPVFSVLLFITFTVTLICRLIFRRGLSSIELETNVIAPRPPAFVFNSTLLNFASVDLGEAQSKREIEQLLEANFGGPRTYKTYATWRRFNQYNKKERPPNSFPVTFRSPAFYRHWLDFRRALSSWVRKKGFTTDIMPELVRLVKDPLDRYNGSVGSDQRYSSCAVVGNSGILLNSDYGKLIDSHEIVIRLNNAKTDNYESKVGSKTSVSFINSNILHLCARREGCFCHPYGPNVPTVMYICQPVHFMDYTICNGSHKSPLLITDPSFDALCSRIVKYYSVKRFVEVTGKSLEEWSSAHEGPLFHYSSGMQAVMLAVGICDKVSIFGFGKSVSAKHHYHTNQKAELGLHDYEAEYAFYYDLIARPQRIPFLSDKFKYYHDLLHQMDSKPTSQSYLQVNTDELPNKEASEKQNNQIQVFQLAETERPFHGFPLRLQTLNDRDNSSKIDTSMLVLDFSVILVEFHVLSGTWVAATCPIGCLLKASAIDRW